MAINNYVTNLYEIIEILKSLGPKWNPVNPKLQIEALEARHAAALEIQSQMKTAIALDRLKTKDRETLFSTLNDLVQRATSAADSCEMNPTTVEKLVTLKDLIDGSNIGKAATRRNKKEEKAKALLPEGATLDETAKVRSVSQQSYDKRLENFKSFIITLETAGGYETNVDDLKLEALKTVEESLSSANKTTESAFKALGLKRDERNEMFDGQTDSITFIVGKVKKELNSMEGNKGLTYLKVAEFQFPKLID